MYAGQTLQRAVPKTRLRDVFELVTRDDILKSRQRAKSDARDAGAYNLTKRCADCRLFAGGSGGKTALRVVSHSVNGGSASGKDALHLFRALTFAPTVARAELTVTGDAVIDREPRDRRTMLAHHPLLAYTRYQCCAVLLR
ncbi:hypothetical protein TcasGA2_TC034863 [Tribolium castaneum]|uniref:Uncharacterized protein n=1 Tax=Tribolium castaneum TaxID=7070 RepID=A0A139WBZ9_TRICA|nr:hypothetical protein TcasGA2_TC034863 [Tribolium castaneum]